MVLGLYDLDFQHSVTKFPNLELMKIYNYHYQKGDKVIFMTPKMDKGRFNEIIYFKEVPSTRVPKNLNIDMLKDHIYGYGFYKCYTPINQKYQPIPPSYMVYEPYRDKFSKQTYNLIRNHSFVRVENNDFTGFHKGSDKILLADNDIAALPNFTNFLEEYKYYTIIPRQHTITVKDESVAAALYKYRNISVPLYIDFKYSYEFFEEHYKRMVFHLRTPFENESETHYLNRLVRTVLYYKSHGAALPFIRCADKTTSGYIIQWGVTKTNLPYSEFYKNNTDALAVLNIVPKEIRLLLKTKPQIGQSFDLSHYL